MGRQPRSLSAAALRGVAALALLPALATHAADDRPYAVGMGDARAASAIATYRLEKAYYDHLVETARRLAAARGVSPDRRVDVIGLDEPERPIVPLDVGDAPPLGNPDAAVRIIVVENLSQSYTARLDPLLQRLRSRWGERLAIFHRDFVDRTHRRSRAAAIAARCAGRQGKFWEYRALLIGRQGAQERSDLLAHAVALALDGDAFGACLDDDAVAEAVDAESAGVRAAGISTAPVLLVNGRYVRGVEETEVIEGIVSAVMPAKEGEAPAETTLDLRLTGVVLVPGAAPQATIVPGDVPSGRTYGVGEEIQPNVVVTAIARDHVLLRNGARIERLSLRMAATGEAGGPNGLADRALVTENVSVVRLDHDDVERILAHRSEMEAQLQPAPLDLGDGKRLAKLTGDQYHDLFARLGLAPRDVVLRVNDAFVYAGDPALFEAIAAGGETSIVVMRRGIPVRIDVQTGD